LRPVAGVRRVRGDPRAENAAAAPAGGVRMTGLQHLLALEFMRNAFVAGGCIALAAGLVGYFVVLRNQVFTTDALGHVAFTGSLGGLLAGLDLLVGVFGSCIGVAVAVGTLGGRGRRRGVAVG